jgi:hypothetical protein
MRGYKGGQRQALRELAKLLKEHRESLEQISGSDERRHNAN